MNVLQTVLNAMTNASVVPVSPEGAAMVLRTGDGPGSHVRALFGDCSADTLIRYAGELGISDAQLKIAYGTARAKHAAANEGLEEALSASIRPH